MKHISVLTILLFAVTLVKAQNNEPASIHGNFQMDAQTYKSDTIINASKADEIMLMNTYANFIYTKGDFSAGTRFEGYLNTLQGYQPKNEGIGFPHRWAKYKTGNMEITVGSYYEQFGSGLIFRSYEERTLGYDNAMDGIRIKYNIGNGVYLKAIYGQQRLVQKNINGVAQLIKGRGIVRGIDADINVNEIIPGLRDKKTIIIIGSSFVSKFEEDDDPVYKIPQNVGAGAGRINLSRGKVNFMGEYAYKSVDPSSAGTDFTNGNVGQNYIYKPGQGVLTSISYSQKGFSVFVMGKYIDNMNFRAERTAKLNDLNINFIPDINKNHTYTYAAMYPYGTQLNGEAGYKAEIAYKIKKGSRFGGKYGTGLNIVYSRMNNIKKEALSDTSSLISNDGTIGYKSSFLGMGDELLYEDLSFELSKKFSKKLKSIFTLQSIKYNNSIIHGAGDFEGTINSLAFIADVTYKLEKRRSIRTEIQQYSSKDYLGNWSMALFEFSIPHWFFILSDQVNNGIHYFNTEIVYSVNATRIKLGYGKQKEGIVCTGGVCRRVPAANGLIISITSSF